MTAKLFDAIVVGAGIIGSSTAYHLQKAGAKTLLIEQFTLGHTNGSSHGKSRKTKSAHFDSAYIPLVADSTAQIRELEKSRGEQLIVVSESGGVFYGSREKMERLRNTLAQFSLPCDLLNMQEARERFPLYQYGDDYLALADPQAGVILADRWLAAFQDEFVKAGGSVSERTHVNEFSEDERSVLLRTNNGDFRAPKVVFALGSWISKLLPGLPVKGQTQLLSVCYWAPKDRNEAPLTRPEQWPCHSAYMPDGRCFFSMGSVDVEGAVKLMIHGGQDHADTDLPGDIHELFVEDVRAHIAKYVPFLDAVNGPVKVERCKYTMSADAHYVIDYLPGSRNIQVAGCMSGSGFKLCTISFSFWLLCYEMTAF